MKETKRGKREKRERTRKTDTKTDKNREMISIATQIQVDEVSQRGQVRLGEDILFKRAPSGQGRAAAYTHQGHRMIKIITEAPEPALHTWEWKIIATLWSHLSC